MTDNYISIGRVLNYWGSNGAVSVIPMTDNPARFTPGSFVFIGGNKYTISQARKLKHKILIEFKEICSISEAETLKDTLLQIPESELPALSDDTFYHFDIIGLKVLTLDGLCLGTISQILETGANDVYVVSKENGGELLLPAVKDVIKEINPSKGYLKIDTIEGLLD